MSTFLVIMPSHVQGGLNNMQKTLFIHF